MWCPNVAVTASQVRYGDRFLAPAVDLLNQRLAGADTKELIGKPGLETAYRVKQLVQAIKKSAAEFEAGDEQFFCHSSAEP